MTTWKRSTFCGTNACIEVAGEGGRVLVRDSEDARSPVLSYQPSEWMNLVLAKVMLGRMPPMIHFTSRGIRWRGHDVEGREDELNFDRPEWEDFGKGVRAGQFNIEALER